MIFRDRTTVPLFTRYMIAIANNCELLEEFVLDLKARWWKSDLMKHDNNSYFATNIESLLSHFKNLKSDAANFLLDEVFLDIEIQFSKIMTPEWAKPDATEAIDTITTTMNDYFEDFNHLSPKNFEIITCMAQNRVAERYITSLLTV